MMNLGFDELCFKFYINNPETLASDEIFRFRGIEEDIRRKNSHFFDSKEIITAPLYQQAFRWFREKHDLFCEIQVDNTTAPKFCFDIFQYEYFGNYEKIIVEEWFLYRTYEEAEQACLKQLIKTIKNK